MKASGKLTVTQPTPTGEKTITITGNKQELVDLAEDLKRAAD